MSQSIDPYKSYGTSKILEELENFSYITQFNLLVISAYYETALIGPR